MPIPRSSAAQRTRARGSAFLLGVAVVVSTLVSACGSGDQTLDQVDPTAVTANPTYDQVFAIVDRECVTCHKGGDSGTTDLSTCTAIVALRASILGTVVDNTMPPGALPRLNSEKRLIISRWIDNGAPAPCN